MSDHLPTTPDGKPAGVKVDEYVDLPTDGDDDEIVIDDAEDGGILVDLGAVVEEIEHDSDFYANLAEIVEPAVLASIVSDLLTKVAEDKTAREERAEKYAEGIRRTGLGDDAPGGASFTGASRVVHPMLTEAVIDYEARIIRELLPVAGPVRPMIMGKPTAEKTDRARRKVDFMNYQIRVQIKEARAVLEQTLTQVPLGGSQFIRQVWNHRLMRPTWEFAPIDRVFIPFSAASFDTATRKTYWETVPEVEFRRRVEQGLYVPAPRGGGSMAPDPTDAESANDKVEGRSDPGALMDDQRELYEITVLMEVPQALVAALPADQQHEKEGTVCPYIITVDIGTNTVVAMYRAWDQADPAREEIPHLFEWQFIPWRGALGIGFPHIIGGLSGAATGALRALLDAAHVNNTVSGVVLKGSGIGGQNTVSTPGTWMELESGAEADDIRKQVLPFQVNPPSTVLFQLLQFVVEQARGVVRTALEDTPTSGTTPAPVGTQLSKVEEALVVFTAIHGRAHAALDRMLKGLHRLNAMYLPDEIRVDDQGKEILVRREDFIGEADVQPTSDPTIYSDQQRWAQINYIQARAQVMPQLYNLREVELAALRLIKWVDPESILAPAPKPHELNAVNEALAMVLGQPVAVFPEQDHLAHIQAHMDFVRSPALGSNPVLAPAVIPAAVRHIAQHIAYLYVQNMVQTVEAATQADPATLMSNDPTVKRAFDEVLAAASPTVVQNIEATLAQAIPVLQQLAQMAAQFSPKPPMDPATAALQAASAETQRKTAADQAKEKLDAERNQIAAEGNQIKAEGQQMEAETRVATGHANNATALEIAQLKMAEGEKTQFSDGTSLAG